jgi:mRNA interferase YafQ
VKLSRKRGKDMAKLREAILLLLEGSPLPPRYKVHPLGGDWKHFRDCHIEPDWLPIYKIDGNALHLVRTEHTRTYSETQAPVTGEPRPLCQVKPAPP